MSNARAVATILVSLVTAPAAAQNAAEHSITIGKLPAPVRQAISSYISANHATLRGLSVETENDVTRYEAELRISGHSRDVTFNDAGQVVSVEQEVALTDVPAKAREALTRAAGSAHITSVERVTENGRDAYEAHFTVKGKAQEAKVDASGGPVP